MDSVESVVHSVSDGTLRSVVLCFWVDVFLGCVVFSFVAELLRFAVVGLVTIGLAVVGDALVQTAAVIIGFVVLFLDVAEVVVVVVFSVCVSDVSFSDCVTDSVEASGAEYTVCT